MSSTHRSDTIQRITSGYGSGRPGYLQSDTMSSQGNSVASRPTRGGPSDADAYAAQTGDPARLAPLDYSVGVACAEPGEAVGHVGRNARWTNSPRSSALDPQSTCACGNEPAEDPEAARSHLPAVTSWPCFQEGARRFWLGKAESEPGEVRDGRWPFLEWVGSPPHTRGKPASTAKGNVRLGRTVSPSCEWR